MPFTFSAAATTTINFNVWTTWNSPTLWTPGTSAWATWNTIQVTNVATASTLWTAWNIPFLEVGAPAIITRETREETEARVATELLAARARQQARDRARALLLEHLNDEQRHEVAEKRHFHLRSRSGRIFRVLVGQGRHGNVKEIVEGRIVRSFCAAPAGEIPEDDAILGQKLALELSEEDFIRYANVTEVRAA